MNRQRLRIANTELDNLVSNLRGEVGEIVTSWVLMRGFMSDAARVSTGDTKKDLQDSKVSTVNLLIEKMEDDIVGRLSELAEDKIGRLNFFFAAAKLQRFSDDADKFRRLIAANRIREKRNKNIAHKELPELPSRKCAKGGRFGRKCRRWPMVSLLRSWRPKSGALSLWAIN